MTDQRKHVRLKTGSIQAPLEINCKVELDGPGGLTRVGIVRYIGHVHYKTGVFYGIELIDGSLGNNDGCFGEHRYFSMDAKTTRDGKRSPRRLVDKRGVFVRQFKIRRVLRGSREDSASPTKATSSVDFPELSPHKKKQKVGDDKNSAKRSSQNSKSIGKSSSKPNTVTNNGRRSKWNKRLCPICSVDLNINQPLGDRVLDHVLIGGFEQSQDFEGLTLSGVTHVLNCARELPNCFPGTLKYLKFDYADDNKQKILPCFEMAFEFMDQCYDEKGVCLVHCQQGKSRSAAVIAGYLMARRGLSLTAAIERMQAVRRVAKPNDNFMSQLKTFERATKRWRRNPDPKTKRLYALQSFEQPRRKRRNLSDAYCRNTQCKPWEGNKERERRGSIGVTRREKKRKAKPVSANQKECRRESRRKKKAKPMKRKKSLSKSPIANRATSNMWSLAGEESTNNPFILMDRKPEVKENVDPVAHATIRAKKKKKSPRRNTHKGRSTSRGQILDTLEAKSNRSSKVQSIWGCVDDEGPMPTKKLATGPALTLESRPKADELLQAATGLGAEIPPKIEIVEDSKDNEEDSLWFTQQPSPQNLSFHASFSLRESRPSLRADTPPTTPEKTEAENDRDDSTSSESKQQHVQRRGSRNGPYRTSRLPKSRMQRWSPSKRATRSLGRRRCKPSVGTRPGIDCPSAGRTPGIHSSGQTTKTYRLWRLPLLISQACCHPTRQLYL